MALVLDSYQKILDMSVVLLQFAKVHIGNFCEYYYILKAIRSDSSSPQSKILILIYFIHAVRDSGKLNETVFTYRFLQHNFENEMPIRMVITVDVVGRNSNPQRIYACNFDSFASTFTQTLLDKELRYKDNKNFFA